MENNSYDLTRFNAVKHGILSQSTLLPHESKEEFTALIEELKEDFLPTTVTERLLVEELATIVWRKRRLLKAEQARIHHGLNGILNQTSKLLNTASPIQLHIDSTALNLREFLSLSAEELQGYLRALEQESEGISKALQILDQGGRGCSTRALETLAPLVCDLWNQSEDYGSNREDVRDFLIHEAEPLISERRKILSFIEEIKQQALGEAINFVNFDSFARYEAHLDRKYERTLSMLIKLKSLKEVVPKIE